MAFSPDGRQVAAAHGAMGSAPTILVFEVSTGRVLRRLGRHQDTPFAVGWAEDGRTLASAGMDKTVLLYEGDSPLSDMPESDEDEEEEKAKWARDLELYKVGLTEENETAASAPHPMSKGFAGFRAA